MRMSGAWLLALIVAGSAPRSPSPTSPTPRRDSALEAQLRVLASRVNGDVGIYVRHFPSGRTAELNADDLFPTASMIKVPIMLATYQAINDGRLAFDSILTYTDSLDYDDEADILVMAEDSTRIALGRLVMLMLTMSDNTASLWLQSLSGTGVAINEWLSANGFGVCADQSGVGAALGDIRARRRLAAGRGGGAIQGVGSKVPAERTPNRQAWVQTVALQGLELTHCLVVNRISVDRCVSLQ